jgi:hypothetical protein
MPHARLIAPWKDSTEKPVMYHCVSRVVEKRFAFGQEEKEKLRLALVCSMRLYEEEKQDRKIFESRCKSLQEKHDVFLKNTWDTIRAIGLAIGLPEPPDVNGNEQLQDIWRGKMSIKVKAVFDDLAAYIQEIRRIHESLGVPSTYLGDLSVDSVGLINGLFESLKKANEGEAALLRFKQFVHRRLDEMGIPTHPDGEHSAHGCRIGDRLDIIQKKINPTG